MMSSPSAAAGRGKREKIRLVFIAALRHRWLHLEWLCGGLDPERFEISFFLLRFRGQRSEMEDFLLQEDIPYAHRDCSLLPWSLLSAVWHAALYLRRQRAEIVQTHMFLANQVGLLAALLARVPVRIITRHHHLRGRGAFFLWLDRWTNVLATRIIGSTKVVEQDILELGKARPEKVVRIRYGIDLQGFQNLTQSRVDALARKYNPEERYPVVGVLARQIESKGIQYTIPAFRRLLADYPGALLLLAPAHGPYRREILEALATLPEGSYVEVAFEPDVFALYQLFDLCVHVPLGPDLETFGRIFVEALAAEVPSIFTLSGVGPEFLEHRRNAWLVPYRDSEAIRQGMLEILADPSLRRRLVTEGRASVTDAFRMEEMVRRTQDLYLQCMGREPTRSGGA